MKPPRKFFASVPARFQDRPMSWFFSTTALEMFEWMRLAV